MDPALWTLVIVDSRSSGGQWLTQTVWTAQTADGQTDWRTQPGRSRLLAQPYPQPQWPHWVEDRPRTDRPASRQTWRPDPADGTDSIQWRTIVWDEPQRTSSLWRLASQQPAQRTAGRNDLDPNLDPSQPASRTAHASLRTETPARTDSRTMDRTDSVAPSLTSQWLLLLTDSEDRTSPDPAASGPVIGQLCSQLYCIII